IFHVRKLIIKRSAVETASSGVLWSVHSTLQLPKAAKPISSLYLKSQVSSSELGYLTSQLSGIKISIDDGFGSQNHAKSISVSPIRPLFQPVARRICPLTGKKANRANKVSFSNHKTKKL
ncbi:50S ribosomal protein L28 protein, partial [Thalictrum thalictroides]